MKLAQQIMVALGVVSAITVTPALAGWQNTLNNAASQITSSSSSSASTATGGLSSLSGLLNGGDQALSAGNMNNAAGVLQYCVQNNVVKKSAKSLESEVLGKLGLENTQQQSQQTDYQQGLAGLLNTSNGQQINLKALGETPLGEKVKTKACNVVLKQGARFIS